MKMKGSKEAMVRSQNGGMVQKRVGPYERRRKRAEKGKKREERRERDKHDQDRSRRDGTEHVFGSPNGGMVQKRVTLLSPSAPSATSPPWKSQSGRDRKRRRPNRFTKRLQDAVATSSEGKTR